MPRICCIAIAIVASSSLVGCASMHGGSTRYDPAIKNAAGTITLSDPKLYSRETLINERASDVTWINKLIAESEDPTKVAFKPALFREIEEISAFSAALGLKFDPAAGLNYKRANETGEVQQQIDVLKLQLQLDQLRRDAELLRAKLPTQTEPANSGLGTVSGNTTTAATSTVTPPDVVQMTTAINGLITNLTARLDAETKPIGKTEVTSSPLDDFRDRLAYRGVLKAARDAAGLDELHDAGNSRLIRLNFQATAFPDPNNPRALGAIQVRVVDDPGGSADHYLANWLRSINTNGDSRLPNGGLKQTPTLDALENSGDFLEARVGGVDVILPALAASDGTSLSPDDLLRRAEWTRDEAFDSGRFQTWAAKLSVAATRDATLADLCRGSALGLGLDVADAREQSFELIEFTNLVASDRGIALPGIATRAKRDRAVEYRNQVLQLIAKRIDCTGLSAQHPIDQPRPDWKLKRRPQFAGTGQVRIYEVGPREQVEQVSTLARSANSLALAASIAASVPSAGVAGSLSAGFRRDVISRASALERVPEVVGYSVSGKRTFGWVVGPRATADARGRVDMEQLLKPYDLTVDLSVPSWWPEMNLELSTAWAPSPRMLVSGTLEARADEGDHKERAGSDDKRVVTVPLPSAVADYQAFTQFLISNKERSVRITEVAGGPINACVATTLLIKGDNLWRAEKVMLIGTLLDRDKFIIAPDMQGILVTVPAIPVIPGEQAFKEDPTVHVLTPFGSDAHAIKYDATLTGDACKPKPAAAAAAAADTVAISKISPDSFVVPSKVAIDVTGTKLGGIDEIKLASQKGVISKKAEDGTSMTVEFDKDATSSIEAGHVKLEFFSKGKGVGTPQDVRISRN